MTLRGTSRVAMTVRLLLPTFDGDGLEHSVFDELVDRSTALRDVEHEVVRQVADGADTEHPCADLEQRLTRLLLGGGRRGEHLGRDRSLGDVVDTLEARPAVRRHLAGPEQVLERLLALAVPPPRPALLARVAELTGRERPALAHLVEHRLMYPGCFFSSAMSQLRLPIVAAFRHLPSVQRVLLDRQQRRLVSPVLEEVVRSPRERVELGEGIRPEAREERHVVRSHGDVHRVELDHLKSVDDLLQMLATDLARRALLGEALCRRAPCGALHRSRGCP